MDGDNGGIEVKSLTCDTWFNSYRYYPALKTLEQLEHTYLPRVSKYRFATPMCDAVPKVREHIKEASMSDLKDFLESIRKHSEKIGEIAMKHVRFDILRSR